MPAHSGVPQGCPPLLGVHAKAFGLGSGSQSLPFFFPGMTSLVSSNLDSVNPQPALPGSEGFVRLMLPLHRERKELAGLGASLWDGFLPLLAPTPALTWPPCPMAQGRHREGSTHTSRALLTEQATGQHAEPAEQALNSRAPRIPRSP